jgi:hypothetical protein
MSHLLARQVFRQRTPCRLPRLYRALDRCRDEGRSDGHSLGLIGFQRLDRQLELFGFSDERPNSARR